MACADWTLHEQVATAALECGCQHKAAPLVKAVLAKFPESLRAKRLQASRWGGARRGLGSGRPGTSPSPSPCRGAAQPSWASGPPVPC